MYPQHLKTFAYRGLHQYFLTFCTYDRDPLLAAVQDYPFCGSSAYSLEQVLEAIQLGGRQRGLTVRWRGDQSRAVG